MSFTVTTAKTIDHVTVRASGIITTYEEFLNLFQEFIYASREYDCHAFLLDVRDLNYIVGVHQLIAFGERMAALGLPIRGMRIASVCTVMTLGQDTLLEVVLRNRSIRYRAFSEIKEAETWLYLDEKGAEMDMVPTPVSQQTPMVHTA